MTDVSQEEMVQYLRVNLPGIMMTCEDPNAVLLWTKYGTTEGLWDGSGYDFTKIPDQEAQKQIWDYTYAQLTWDRETPGAAAEQNNLGKIRLAFNQLGWRWAGADYVNGIYIEKFVKDKQLIVLEYGTRDVILPDAPITGGMVTYQGPILQAICDSLSPHGWALKSSTYTQGVVYASFESGGYGVRIELGGMAEVMGEEPGHREGYEIMPGVYEDDVMAEAERRIGLYTELKINNDAGNLMAFEGHVNALVAKKLGDMGVRI